MKEKKQGIRQSAWHLVIAQEMADMALNACCALHVYWRVAWMPCWSKGSFKGEPWPLPLFFLIPNLKVETLGILTSWMDHDSLGKR